MPHTTIASVSSTTTKPSHLLHASDTEGCKEHVCVYACVDSTYVKNVCLVCVCVYVCECVRSAGLDVVPLTLAW